MRHDLYRTVHSIERAICDAFVSIEEAAAFGTTRTTVEGTKLHLRAILSAESSRTRTRVVIPGDGTAALITARIDTTRVVALHTENHFVSSDVEVRQTFHSRFQCRKQTHRPVVYSNILHDTLEVDRRRAYSSMRSEYRVRWFRKSELPFVSSKGGGGGGGGEERRRRWRQTTQEQVLRIQDGVTVGLDAHPEQCRAIHGGRQRPIDKRNDNQMVEAVVQSPALLVDERLRSAVNLDARSQHARLQFGGQESVRVGGSVQRVPVA